MSIVCWNTQSNKNSTIVHVYSDIWTFNLRLIHIIRSANWARKSWIKIWQHHMFMGARQSLHTAKSRKYQGVFKVKSREKTRQVRGIWSQQLKNKRVPKRNQVSLSYRSLNFFSYNTTCCHQSICISLTHRKYEHTLQASDPPWS